MELSKCPLCGGDILLTQQEYRYNVTIDVGGTGDYISVVDPGKFWFEDETAVFCENGHSEDDILEALGINPETKGATNGA